MVVVFFAMAAAASVALGGERQESTDSVKLAWRFKTGDRLTLTFDQSQSVLTRIDTRDRSVETSLTLVVGWQVRGVAENGDASIEQTIERIRIRTGAPGAEVKKIVDIDTDANQMLRGVSREVFKQVKTLIGLKFNITMNRSGKVVDISAGDNVASVLDQLPETSTQLKNVFDVDQQKKLIEQSSLVLPQKEVTKSDSWSDDSTVSISGNDGRTYSLERKSVATVKSLDDGSANIDIQISLTQPKNKSGDPTTALTSPIELLNQSANGKVIFDRKQGIVSSSKIESEINTKVVYRKDVVKTRLTTTSELTVTRK